MSARAYRNVIAGGVVFESSPDNERGFGSRRVAVCYSTVCDKLIDVPHGATRLIFDGYLFRDLKQKVVEYCDMLYLQDDGTMYAVIDAKTIHDRREAARIAA